MEANIKDCYKENQREKARELCRQLLALDSKNKIALNILALLNKNKL